MSRVMSNCTFVTPRILYTAIPFMQELLINRHYYKIQVCRNLKT